jgi:hypothetical protein
MQRFQDSSGFIQRHALPSLAAGVLAFCCVVALVLVELAISRRSTSELISEAARAELGGLDQTDVTAPPGYAQPVEATQTARAN